MRRSSLRSQTSWMAVLLLAVSGAAFGQEGEVTGGPRLTEPGEVFEDEIETDRDSFTPATSVVGRRRVVVESSYSLLDNRDGAETHSFPELLTRVGITENVELRLGWNYEIGGGGSVSSTASPALEEPFADGAEEEGTLLYGFKVSLTEQNCWLPQSALIVQANTPTAGPDHATQFSTGYVFGWTLPNAWTLDSALRYAAASEKADHFNQWAPSIVLKVPFEEKWKAHIEYFGIFTQNRESERGSQYVSPGIHYLVTPDFEVGIRVGWGLSNDSARFFSNVGAGLRF